MTAVLNPPDEADKTYTKLSNPKVTKPGGEKIKKNLSTVGPF